MTKEELEKEAREYRESKRHKSFRADVGTVQINYESYLNNLQQAYLAGAEPREKRIADLEAENARLKEDLKICEGNADNYYTRLMELQEQTIKATGIGLSCENCNWNQFDEDEMCYCCSNKDKWELRR